MNILLIVFIILAIRTALWHAQNWQLREYRFDRMQAYLRTKNGRKSLWNLWFFPGILPRPKWSARSILLIAGGLFFGAIVCVLLSQYIALFWALLIGERSLWLGSLCATFLTDILRKKYEYRLYSQAKQIRKSAQNCTFIGITGSYGKSTTRRILTHVLQHSFGVDAVLATPRNENTEIAIARWVIANAAFLKNEKQCFAVVEVGAYKKGEIAQVCDFILPDVGVITAIELQHLSLFGSIENLKQAKWEIAEGATKRVYINAESQNLVAHATTSQLSIPVYSVEKPLNIKTEMNQLHFDFNGTQMTLPWAGAHFAENAYIALRVAQDLGADATSFASALMTVRQTKNALSAQKNSKGTWILRDLHTANLSGSLAAFVHLALVPGQKIIAMLPLRELGTAEEGAHKQIFEAVKAIGAELWWWRDDHAEMGKGILGDQFHVGDFDLFTRRIKALSEGDAVLLESRLPPNITQFFDAPA